MKKNIVLILSILLLSGCYQLKPDKSNSVRKIAILPAINSSNDVEEPKTLVDSIALYTSKQFYEVIPTTKSTKVLKDEFSITLGKQLADITPKELSEKLEVDGLIYVYLFDAKTIAASKNYYRMGIKLVQGDTGKILYARGVAIKKPFSSGDISSFVNLATDISDTFGDTKAPPVPTSKHPNKEMPGLDQWIQISAPSESNNGGILGGLIRVAVASLFDTTFTEERQFALQSIFVHTSKADSLSRHKFPAGPVEKK